MPPAMRFQRFARAVLGALLNALLDWEIIGLENMPADGPLIVIMNHIHFLDPILVSVGLPRDIAIMSKVENLRAPVLGPLARWYGSFPVHRGQLDLSAMRSSLQALERGYALLLAPEGTRSKSKRLQPGQDGTAFVATRSGAPLLPVGLYGNENFLSNLKRFRRTPCTMVIGKPFVFELNGHRPRREALSAMTREAMYQIADLLPPSYRGQFADSPDGFQYTKPYMPENGS